jgi:sortase (surface protein transpeptidase)
MPGAGRFARRVATQAGGATGRLIGSPESDDSSMATSKHRRRRTRRVLLLDAVAVGLALAGLVTLGLGRMAAQDSPPVRVSGTLGAPTTSARPSTPSIPAARPRVGHPAPARPHATPARPHAAPVRLTIPAIGVRTRLVRLGLNADGTLQVPSDFSVAGWYELGPRPGDRGASVIAGHVDSTAGPAVFYRLGGLAPGSPVRVALADRTVVQFRVYAVREYPKARFPASLVYAATPAPELRLVTCGGPFDAQTGHYLDNIVVFARQSTGNAEHRVARTAMA